MPQYYVAHKIRTVAELLEPQSINGFTLCTFDPDGEFPQEAWEASEVLEGNDFLEALNRSRERLLSLVDALAVVMQCAFSVSGMSFQVLRQTENEEGILYFRHLRDRKTVGITLWQSDQADDVKRLLEFARPAAWRFFREAINAVTISSQLAMLVTTAEALAGQGKVNAQCSNCGHEYTYGGTDRTRLKTILGESAYASLYTRKGGSLRNRLLHGSPVDEVAAGELCQEVYGRIRNFISKDLGLQHREPIRNAPRRFDSFEWFGTFLRTGSANPVPLRDLERDWQAIGDWVHQPEVY